MGSVQISISISKKNQNIKASIICGSLYFSAVNLAHSYSAVSGTVPSKAFSQLSTPMPFHAFIIILPGVTGRFSVALYASFPSTYQVMPSSFHSNA